MSLYKFLDDKHYAKMVMNESETFAGSRAIASENGLHFFKAFATT